MNMTIFPARLLDVADGRDIAWVTKVFTADLSVPDDVDITTMSLHETAPGVVGMVARITSASSTAFVVHFLSALTAEFVTPLVRQLVEDGTPLLRADGRPLSAELDADNVSVVHLSKPLTVINYPLLPLAPPSSPPTSPPPPSLTPPPPSPPSPIAHPPPPPPKGDRYLPLWGLLLLVVGLSAVFIVLFVLGYRRHSRVSRDRANLRISRDRAKFDLQLMSHQVQVRVQIQSDDSASLPDSLRSKRSTSLRKTQATSLPPGPPSSSNDQSVVEQEEDPALSAALASTWHANRFGAAANSGEEPMAPAPATAAPTGGLFSLLRRASFFTPSKRPAPPDPASAPRAKRAVTLNSPPAMLPPGAPPASESSIAPLPASLQSLAEGEGAQSSGSALTAPALELEEDFEPTAAELAAFLADEEVISEMQNIVNIAHEVLEVSEDRPSRKRTQALKSTFTSPMALAPARARALNPNPRPHALAPNSSDTFRQYHADDPSRGAHGATAASYLFS
jgi:hypothetical protein